MDTSAIVAIFYNKPEKEKFIQLIYDSDSCSMNVAHFVELCMVVESQLGSEAARQIDAFFRRAQITVEPVTVEHGHLARQAFLDYGKGRHPAALNFGDCFSYALSKASGEPLLFKGNDFRKTDLEIVF